MSIIEAIKNGAKFRHRAYGKPTDFHVMKNGSIAVTWEDEPLGISTYTESGAIQWFELIPEEEELWMVVPKKWHNWPTNEKQATDFGDAAFGSGNYTIHKITRTK